MFELDIRSRLPIYEQLVEKFKELIITEILKPDDQLPSVRILAQQLTINPNTIQKAYRELEGQGYIYSIKGKGSFVTPSLQMANGDKLKKLKIELSKLLSEAMYLGMKQQDILDMVVEIDQVIRGGKSDD